MAHSHGSANVLSEFQKIRQISQRFPAILLLSFFYYIFRAHALKYNRKHPHWISVNCEFVVEVGVDVKRRYRFCDFCTPLPCCTLPPFSVLHCSALLCVLLFLVNFTRPRTFIRLRSPAVRHHPNHGCFHETLLASSKKGRR